MGLAKQNPHYLEQDIKWQSVWQFLGKKRSGYMAHNTQGLGSKALVQLMEDGPLMCSQGIIHDRNHESAVQGMQFFNILEVLHDGVKNCAAG